MNKNKLSKLIILILSFCFISSNAIAINQENVKIPQRFQKEAEGILKLFVNANLEKVYSLFDDTLKKEVPIADLKILLSNIEKVLSQIDTVKLKKTQYFAQEGGLYAFVYHLKTESGQKIEYMIYLKETKSGVFIRGFNFKTPITTVTPLHIIVGILFAICLLIQLWCVIYFTRKKDLKRKWLYIISSFIGLPAGVGINWATGAFILRFGFNIPAVSISWPADQPGVFLMSVFFPIGLILLIIEKNKKAKSSVPKKIEVIDS